MIKVITGVAAVGIFASIIFMAHASRHSDETPASLSPAPQSVASTHMVDPPAIAASQQYPAIAKPASTVIPTTPDTLTASAAAAFDSQSDLRIQPINPETDPTNHIADQKQ